MDSKEIKKYCIKRIESGDSRREIFNSLEEIDGSKTYSDKQKWHLSLLYPRSEDLLKAKVLMNALVVLFALITCIHLYELVGLLKDVPLGDMSPKGKALTVFSLIPLAIGLYVISYLAKKKVTIFGFLLMLVFTLNTLRNSLDNLLYLSLALLLFVLVFVTMRKLWPMFKLNLDLKKNFDFEKI